MFRNIVWILCWLFASSAHAANDVEEKPNKLLQQYIKEALENNLALRQKEFSLQKSVAALNEARGRFLPSLNIITRYSRAGGGRTIDMPIGDLVNPIHQSLNELFQQPVFQPGLYYNYKIKVRMNQMQQTDKNIFVRHLVADVKTAYFNYLKAVRISELYEKTELLLKENLRVSEKLFENQKATQEVVFRAKAELSELEQEKAGAEKDLTLTSAYFNFLLNRSLEQPVEILEFDSLQFHSVQNIKEVQTQALQQRDEIKQLQIAIEAAANHVKLTRTAYLPAVSLALDYGIQGERFRFKGDDDYWMASVVLQWNMFNGFQDKAKTEQAVLEKMTLETQLAELKKQIQLQVREAHSNLIVAEKTVRAARDRLTSSRQFFHLVNKKYHQGLAPQIEYLDARTTLTRAEINHIITTYDYYIRTSEMEKVAALITIDY